MDILRRPFVVIIAGMLILGIVWGSFFSLITKRSTPHSQDYLPTGPVPDFALTESHGQSITRADLAGKIWVVELMYTSCGNTCPLLSAAMQSLDRKLGQRDDLRLVSITVTPGIDTPEVLRRYAARYHASDKWIFLTGERSQILKLANDGLWLSPGSPDTLTHSDKLVLIDRAGSVRGYFDGTKSETIPMLVEAIHKLEDAK